VEFALIAPVLFALLFGIIDLGRIFWADQDVATAAREGARYAIGGARFADCAGIKTAAANLGTRSQIAASGVTIQYDSGPGTAVFGSCPIPYASLVSGQRLVVTVTRTVDPLTPVFGPVTVHATERRTIIKRAGT
jgi:Flp pilus assembly protein TadG